MSVERVIGESCGRALREELEKLLQCGGRRSFKHEGAKGAEDHEAGGDAWRSICHAPGGFRCVVFCEMLFVVLGGVGVD